MCTAFYAAGNHANAAPPSQGSTVNSFLDSSGASSIQSSDSAQKSSASVPGLSACSETAPAFDYSVPSETAPTSNSSAPSGNIPASSSSAHSPESSVNIPMLYYRLQQMTSQFYRDLQSQTMDTEQLIQDFFYSLTKSELPFAKFKEQMLNICYNVYLISCSLSGSAESACDLNDMYLHIESAETKNHVLLAAKNSVTGICRAAENKIRHRFSKYVQETLDFIDLHYVEKLSLSQAADLLEISSSHLCRLLKKETGKTFVELLTETRMQHAVHLLRETHMKAYEVAYAVGFDNYPYFYQLYKKKTGKSPSKEKAS